MYLFWYQLCHVIINNSRQWRVVRVDADGSQSMAPTMYVIRNTECRATARAFERSRNDGMHVGLTVHVSHSDESWTSTTTWCNRTMDIIPA